MASTAVIQALCQPASMLNAPQPTSAENVDWSSIIYLAGKWSLRIQEIWMRRPSSGGTSLQVWAA